MNNMEGVKKIKKPDYFLKAEILKNNKQLLKVSKQYHYLVYKLYEGKNVIYYNKEKDRYDTMPLSVVKYNNYDENLVLGCMNEIYDIPQINTIGFILNANSQDDIDECQRINNATYKRFARLKDRIKTYLLYSNAMFLTLTFNEDTLLNTSEETRAKYVKRYLKANCLNYVANIDYGRKNEREHYHAVVVPKGKISYKDWYDNYGAIKGEHIHTPNEEKLSMYITKLTNHAIKETNRTCMVIYSRD